MFILQHNVKNLPYYYLLAQIIAEMIDFLGIQPWCQLLSCKSGTVCPAPNASTPWQWNQRPATKPLHLGERWTSPWKTRDTNQMTLMMMMMMMMRRRMRIRMRGKWWSGGGWCWGGRPVPRPGSTLYTSLRCRIAHRHFTRAHVHEVYRANGLGHPPWPVFLCEPAQSKCTWILHWSHSVCKFKKKMQNNLLLPRLNTELQHLPSEPLSVATLFGERSHGITN